MNLEQASKEYGISRRPFIIRAGKLIGRGAKE